MSTQKRDGRGRPSKARRAILTDSAVSLAAAAGALGQGQPDDAQTLSPSVVDWINVTNNPGLSTLAKGDGKTDDTAAIQGALNTAAPGAVVYLPGPTLGAAVAGSYLVSAPLIVPSGVIVLGDVPVGELASLLNGQYGTTLLVSSAWAQGSAPAPGVIVFGRGGTNTVYNPVVKNLWIDCHTGPAPAGVHGIASGDSVQHAVIDRVGIASATGSGIYASSVPGRQDAWHITNVIVEMPTGTGVYYQGNDCFMSNVHAQNGNTHGTGDGFYLGGGNNRLIGCRADSCANGYTIDTRQNGAFTGTNILSACGTQYNLQNGLNVINSTATATAMSVPCVATGCSFDGDGMNGSPYAGISVFGANIAILNACNVNVTSTSPSGEPYPLYALSFGNNGYSDPNLIQALGGWWTAADSLINGSDSNTVLSYAVHGYVGGQFAHGDKVSVFESSQLLVSPRCPPRPSQGIRIRTGVRVLAS